MWLKLRNVPVAGGGFVVPFFLIRIFILSKFLFGLLSLKYSNINDIIKTTYKTQIDMSSILLI